MQRAKKNPDRAVENSSQKGEKMRIFATTIKLFAITSLVFAATQATAVDCTPGPQCVDTIVVTPGDDGAGGDFIGGSGIRGIGGGGGGSTPPDWLSLIRLDKRFCKSASEPCDSDTFPPAPNWRSRVVATTCASYGPGIQPYCNTEVVLEAKVNMCANTNPC